MNVGKVFENDFKKSAETQGLWILRLNDTSLSWMKEKNMRFTPTNISDFLIYDFPYLYAIECKSTGGKSISIQRSEEDTKGMIAAHQIKDLTKTNEAKGVYAVLVLNFRNDDNIKEDITYVMSIDSFNKFLIESEKKSINKEDCVQYGGILINQNLKRTHYSYDVKQMLADISGAEKGDING